MRAPPGPRPTLATTRPEISTTTRSCFPGARRICESPEGRDDETQCAPRGGRPYAFILHGLWPQYERGYPEECPTRTRPYVSQNIIDDMFDIMPSRRLIIHEYRKHGTCSGLTPEGYYQTARRIFESITIPQKFRNPPQDQYMSPGDVVRAFVEANPNLRPDMIGVAPRPRHTLSRSSHLFFEDRYAALMRAERRSAPALPGLAHARPACQVGLNVDLARS